METSVRMTPCEDKRSFHAAKFDIASPRGKCTLLVASGIPFGFRTALILCDFETFLSVLYIYILHILYIDMIMSHSCCRFVGCTSIMWISYFTKSQMCFIGLRTGDCGGHWSTVSSLSCWSEDGWYTVVRKRWTQMDGHRQAAVFKRCLTGTKGPSVPRVYPPRITAQPAWIIKKRGWSQVLILFLANIDPTIWMLQLKLRLIRRGNVFPIFIFVFFPWEISHFQTIAIPYHSDTWFELQQVIFTIFKMPKCIEFLPCYWLISYLCLQGTELIKWPVSVVPMTKPKQSTPNMV